MAKRGRPPKKWPKYSEDEIRKMIKKVNDSLYRLEKAGLQEQSAEYRMIEKYAISNPNGTGNMYNVNEENGTIRVSKDLSRHKTKKERAKFVEILEGILKAETRTVSGTRKAMNRGFETVKSLYDYKGTLNEYVNVWKEYKRILKENKKTKIGSDKVIELLETTNLYSLSINEIKETLKIIARGRNADSGTRTAFRKIKGLKKNKAARKRKL